MHSLSKYISILVSVSFAIPEVSILFTIYLALSFHENLPKFDFQYDTLTLMFHLHFNGI